MTGPLYPAAMADKFCPCGHLCGEHTLNGGCQNYAMDATANDPDQCDCGAHYPKLVDYLHEDIERLRGEVARLQSERDNATRELERCRNRSVEMVTEACEQRDQARAEVKAAKADALREARDQAMRGHANGVIHWLSAYIAEQSGIAARAADTRAELGDS